MYDVTIIGAGPSGSLLAFYLARNNFSVLLIDKKPFPRPKLCGGGISYKAYNIIKDIVDLDSINSCAVEGAFLSYKNEDLRYVGQGSYKSYSIHRSEFDELLLTAALNAGAEKLIPAKINEINELDDHVTLRTEEGQTINTRFLVFATGVNGTLHEKLGYTGKRQITVAFEIDIFPEKIPEPLKNNTLFDFGSVKGGYAWLFPKHDRINAGIYFHNNPKPGKYQSDQINDFLKLFDWAEGAKKSIPKGYPLPYNYDYKYYNTHRTLLVGDAAGTVENFYGEGIFYGLSSSGIAADVLTKALRQYKRIDDYTSILKREIITHVKYSRATAFLFYRYGRFGYYNMVRNKLMNYFYGELIHGNISQRKCFYYSALTLPLSPLSGKVDIAPYNDIGMRK